VTTFRLENKRLLEVTLQNEKVMAKAGSMVAYDGQIKFDKSVLGGEGLFGALKRRAGGEGMPLMTTSGYGRVYLAENAAEIVLIPLHGEKIFIEGSSLLAFEDGLRTNTVFAGLRGATSGQGLFTTTLEGHGQVAAISEGTAIELEVSPNDPLFVDPDAFIGFKGNVRQEFVFDVNWKTFAGQSSGESYQLKFTGQGIVYIQPSERG
jgi:uncharacterized protein (AIM24 family)